jgi:hypothetical protein
VTGWASAIAGVPRLAAVSNCLVMGWTSYGCGV